MLTARDVQPEIHRALFAVPETCARPCGARVRMTPTALEAEGAPEDDRVVEDIEERLF